MQWSGDESYSNWIDPILPLTKHITLYRISENMKKQAVVCLLVVCLGITGCVSDDSPVMTSDNSPATTDGPEYVNDTVREELLERESNRVKDMLSDRDYDEYGIGGAGSPETTILNRNDTGVNVEVSIPYYYTYQKEPDSSRANETVTPVEVTVDQVLTAVYFVNASTITRVG